MKPDNVFVDRKSGHGFARKLSTGQAKGRLYVLLGSWKSRIDQENDQPRAPGKTIAEFLKAELFPSNLCEVEEAVESEFLNRRLLEQLQRESQNYVKGMTRFHEMLMISIILNVS